MWYTNHFSRFTTVLVVEILIIIDLLQSNWYSKTIFKKYYTQLQSSRKFATFFTKKKTTTTWNCFIFSALITIFKQKFAPFFVKWTCLLIQRSNYRMKISFSGEKKVICNHFIMTIEWSFNHFLCSYKGCWHKTVDIWNDFITTQPFKNKLSV